MKEAIKFVFWAGVGYWLTKECLDSLDEAVEAYQLETSIQQIEAYANEGVS